MTVEKKSERKLSLGALGDAVVKGVKFVGASLRNSVAIELHVEINKVR